MIKSTTQNAPLEAYLAKRRCTGIANYVTGKRVLDYGCGLSGATPIYMSKSGALLVDGCDASLKQYTRIDSRVALYPSLTSLPRSDYEVVTAFAVFEHLEPLELIEALKVINQLTLGDACIVGTVPTPRSRPVLEFISYKLRLVDRSQIQDHKVYYDDLWLSWIVGQAGWYLAKYSLFQLGMNSRFQLRKKLD